jgi:hypothetical protein
MTTIPAPMAGLHRVLEQMRSVREHWAQRIFVALENRKAAGRRCEGRHEAHAESTCAVERRRFRSDAQLRAERAEDKREWVNSSSPRKREEV